VTTGEIAASVQIDGTDVPPYVVSRMGAIDLLPGLPPGASVLSCIYSGIRRDSLNSSAI
jgi:hypothetical protein